MRGGARLASLAFPLIVALGMTTLVALDVNGSSVGVLSVADQPDPSLLAGTPRGIRSDEAALSTPNFVGNIRRGLPAEPWIGLTPTFLPATSIGVVSDHWTEAFKPQDWGAFVLRPDRAFAWHWWAQLAIAMLGLYALLVTLTRRTALDGLTPQEFLAVDPRFIEATGVVKTLTPSRVNGFYNIHERLKAEALMALARQEGKA